MNLMSDLAYTAGIIDGEGSIGVRKRGKYITPIVQVTNTDKLLLEWLVRHWGGSIYSNKEPRPRRKALWSWQLFGDSAQQLLREIRPYLVIKKERADLAITVPRFSIKNVGSPVMSAEDFKANEALVARFHVLNQRGVPYP